jgi:fatty acid desaturase
MSWLIGGLTFQIEHHLFPHICHVHYPKLSHIVRRTAASWDSMALNRSRVAVMPDIQIKHRLPGRVVAARQFVKQLLSV